ncbi:solute carrier family 35, member E3 [Strigomonas culicis]|nr:solute carrier family 35, member E3 [Strigomonas culicis]|eukprot:EPY36472.1 solute carrier family 35, member E3 [Strigomonas culicis]
MVFKYYCFPYGTTLTIFHFFVTFLSLLVCLKFRVFQFKRIPILKVMPLCASFCGFVVLTNVSLLKNTVGFYQLMKVLTTPFLVVIQTLFYHQKFSKHVVLSLGVICVGVIIATFNDTKTTISGTLVALSAVLVTCMYQIWVGTKQKELDCNGYQLLLYQAPISALLLLPIATFTEDYIQDMYLPEMDTILMIFLTGVLAFLVNLSIFLVIGKTSPVTYNVLGHTKLCIILSMGFVFFKDQLNWKMTLGIVMTVGGVVWYTYLKQEEHRVQQTVESTRTKEFMAQEDPEKDPVAEKE